MTKLKTIFMGTPEFCLPALELLATHPAIDLTLVVSMPDRPSGRGQELKSPPVIDFCKEHKINFIQTENINKEEEFFNYQADIIVVLAFAQFLGEKILSLPKIGCFNIHTSLLPKYRGAAPIQYALLNGDKTSGVSIQKMVKKMDAGDVAISDEMPIYSYENAGLLSTRLKFQAALSLATLLDQILNQKVKYQTQDESKVTFAPTFKKQDGFINFSTDSAQKIKLKVKALDPWPSGHCLIDGKFLKIFSVEDSTQTIKPGVMVNYHGQLHVGCVDGSLRLIELQIEGKKRTSDFDFLKGYKGELKL